MTLSASATQEPLSYHRHAPVWRGVLSAFCASLIGIGLARFAYSALLPAIVGAHWFEPATAAYLGAANLAGYLAGALLGRPISACMRVVTVLRASMALATLAFFACAFPLNFAWFFAWRFASGLAGGALMVLAAPTVLPSIRALRGEAWPAGPSSWGSGRALSPQAPSYRSCCNSACGQLGSVWGRCRCSLRSLDGAVGRPPRP
jgi:MFS family permease